MIFLTITYFFLVSKPQFPAGNSFLWESYFLKEDLREEYLLNAPETEEGGTTNLCINLDPSY